MHRGLLVPLPVPPVALRPARHQGGRRAYGPAARGHGSFGVEVDATGVLTIDTREDHARARCRSRSGSRASSRRWSGMGASDGEPGRRALLRLYPRPWRDRYGEEMLALLEARPRRRRRPLGPGPRRGRRVAPSGDAVAVPGRGGGERRRPVDVVALAVARPAGTARLAGLSRRDPAAGRRRCRGSSGVAVVGAGLRIGRRPRGVIRLIASTLAVVGYLAWVVGAVVAPAAGRYGGVDRRPPRRRRSSGLARRRDCRWSAAATGRSARLVVAAGAGDAAAVGRRPGWCSGRVDGDRRGRVALERAGPRRPGPPRPEAAAVAVSRPAGPSAEAGLGHRRRVEQPVEPLRRDARARARARGSSARS